MTAIIHVVDDDALFRKGVARLLRACGYQVAVYESGDGLLAHPPEGAPGCILLDLRMAGLGGLELQDRLAAIGHALPIVFLTGHGDIPASVRAIKAGAEDFLSKPVPKETLLGAIERAVVRCEKAQVDRRRLDGLRALVATLTPREHEVFKLVVRGRLNKQIAYELGTAERTVKAHRHCIMQKLQVRSVAEAVSMAEHLGVLTDAGAHDNK